MNFGFSYIGLLFLCMLMIPNMLWTKNQPKDYEKYVVNESKILLLFERCGEVLVTCVSLIFMIVSVVILGIGHIGIHLNHKKEVTDHGFKV